MATKTKKTTKPQPKKMSDAECKRRGRAIKRYFKDKYETHLKKNPQDQRIFFGFMRIMDQIGHKDLEAFLSFVGAGIDRDVVETFVGIVQVEDMFEALKTKKSAMRDW